jgi:hypothetical protein
VQCAAFRLRDRRQFGDPLPTDGLRDFRRINESMGAVTGVDPNTAAVKAVYDGLALQLPATADLRTFASAQQVAVTKLSLEYCNSLVDTTNLRTAFFGNVVDFNAPATTVFASQATRDALVQRLVDRMFGVNVTSQPNFTEVQPVLDSLMDSLTTGCTPATCDAERTRTIVKSMCAATLASAAASIH